MTELLYQPFPGLSPTGEKWISGRHRAHVHAFAEFVRAARAIADDAQQSAAARTGKLDELEAALDGRPGCGGADGPSERLRLSLRETGITADYARHMLQACRKDVHASAYRGWSELLTYCRYAAAPAGRFVLALHDESEEAMKGADALFSAWRVLRILQNCGRDYRDHGRVYLPGAWLRECGIDPAALAGRLADRLARRDPLARTVGLTRWDRLSVCLRRPG